MQAISHAESESLAEASARVFSRKGLEIVFESVGADATITAAIETGQKGGTLIVVGVFSERPRVDMGLVQDRELNVQVSTPLEELTE